MKFPMEWKKVNVVPVHKIINSALKTTDLSLCCLSTLRSLEDFYSTNCANLLTKMTYHPPSQASDLVTLA